MFEPPRLVWRVGDVHAGLDRSPCELCASFKKLIPRYFNVVRKPA